MKNKILAIDFDGVISNPYIVKLKILERFGYQIRIDQTTFGECVKTGIVRKEHYEIANQNALAAGPNKIVLEVDFIKYYKKLFNLPFDLYLVTSRVDKDMDVLYSILEYYNIKMDYIVNTNKKNKYFTLCDISADFHIEDNSFYVSEILKELKSNNTNKGFKLIYYINNANANEKIINNDVMSIRGWQKLYYYLLNTVGQ